MPRKNTLKSPKWHWLILPPIGANVNCDHCGKNFTKAFINHKKYCIEFTNYSCSWKQKDSIVINVTKNLLEDEIWKYILIQNIHEIDLWNKLWGLLILWFELRFHQSMRMFSFSLNEIWILWYYILLSSSITSWYKSRTFSIWIKVTPSKIVYQSLPKTSLCSPKTGYTSKTIY